MNMQDHVPTQFQVTIDYRTSSRLAVWSGMVPAPNMEQAGEIAEQRLRRRSKSLVRVDRIVVR
jgi:hypothetical protein